MRLRLWRRRREPVTEPFAAPVPESEWNTVMLLPYEGALIEFVWDGRLCTGRYSRPFLQPWGTAWYVRMSYVSSYTTTRLVPTARIARWRYK